jgi:AcrR family transcriptional regulator
LIATLTRVAPNPRRPYHHGDLRRAAIDVAVEAIGEEGVANLSLRDVARRLGVSHAAPTHHFGDKAGLLTAVAAEGYRRLAAALRDAWTRTGSFLEVGVAYVRFAVEERAYFAVMYQPDLYRPDDPEVVAARAEAAAMLYPRVPVDAGRDRRRLEAGVAAWSLVHGVATLFLSGNLPTALGDDPEAIARAAAGYLFGPAEPAPRPA